MGHNALKLGKKVKKIWVKLTFFGTYLIFSSTSKLMDLLKENLSKSLTHALIFVIFRHCVKVE